MLNFLAFFMFLAFSAFAYMWTPLLLGKIVQHTCLKDLTSKDVFDVCKANA